MMKLRKLRPDEVAFTVHCEQEELPIKGNVMASGDERRDQDAEHAVRAMLLEGNVWAWCFITVTASYGDFEGTDILGCCSYDDEAAFKSDAYWEDMKVNALENLRARLEDAFAQLADLVVDDGAP